MNVRGLQKLTLLDYPGQVACTVFTGGCNFRCPFCHNRDLVLTPNGPGISEEDFFNFLKKRTGILDGVCVTGGEPLLSDGIEDFLSRIRSLGYLIKLDTNGSFPDRLPSLPLANYLHNKIFPDFARFSLLFFASYVIIIM